MSVLSKLYDSSNKLNNKYGHYFEELLAIIKSSKKYIVKIVSGLVFLTLLNNTFRYGIINTIKSIRAIIVLSIFVALPFIFLYLEYKIYKKYSFPNNIILMALLYWISINAQNKFIFVKYIFMNFFGTPDNGINSINFDTIGTNITDNSVFSVLPHGATVNTCIYVLRYIYDKFGKFAYYGLAPNLMKIPFISSYASLYFNPVSIDENIIKKYLIKPDPFVIYPGAIKDVLKNSYKNADTVISINTQSKMFDMLFNNNKAITPLIITNENNMWYHPNFIVNFCKYINKYIRIGLPTPYFGKFWIPYMPSFERLNMVIGDSIIPNNFNNKEQFVTEYISQVKKIIEYSIEKYGKNIILNLDK